MNLLVVEPCIHWWWVTGKILVADQKKQDAVGYQDPDHPPAFAGGAASK